jgi:rifampicin phosphotransferase
MPFVLSLSDASATLENVGGKGLSLAKMLSAGLPVPGGFHVTTEAYRRFVTANGIQAQILATVAGIDPADHAALEAASGKIAALFAAGRTPSDIAAAVAAAYEPLNNAPVAVRSSATAEDLPGASFAGQQETYLNISGTEAVLAAVKRCWASLWTARAIAYRLKNQIDQESVALAVVVQNLVFTDAAGVMFTANPANGKRDQLVINAAWGLGEAVVSGTVTPDTLTVAKATGKIIQGLIAEKRLMTVRTEQGTHEVAVPDAQQRQAVLTGAQTATLARLGVQIEQFYQMPMDVEWALAGGKFSIVQARPITVLPPEWKMSVPRAMYTRSSLAEYIPSPVTPLFTTFGLEIAKRVSYETMVGRVGAQTAADMIPDGAEYETVNGYVYRRNRIAYKVLFKLMWGYLPEFLRMARTSVAMWQNARQEFITVITEWERKDIASFMPSQLLDGARTVLEAAVCYYNEFQAFIIVPAASEGMFTKVYESLIRGKQDPAAATFMLGLETVSVKADKSLFDIAMWLKANPVMADYALQTQTAQMEADFRQTDPPAVLPAAVWAEWRSRVESHLRQYGRTAYGYDFSNPTPQEQPSLVFDAVRAFLTGTAGDPYQRQRDTVAKREQAAEAILSRVGWPRRGWFQKLLYFAHKNAVMREDSIYDIGKGHPVVRRMLGELGRRFAAGGAIAQAEDIYWLELSEVYALIANLESGGPLSDLTDRVPARRQLWQAQLKLVPPIIMPENSRMAKYMHGGEAETRDGKVVLKGMGTSAGVVTAPACVLFGPEDFDKLRPGDVLVAVTTNPAWTPLFSLASAVVTDIGGPLSHSSIVAREYGVPAVMATTVATRTIKTGQTVTVNGSAGTVTLE